MGYKDVFIPLVVGLVFIFRGFQRNRKNLRTGGYVLLAIAMLYIFIILRTKTCLTC